MDSNSYNTYLLARLSSSAVNCCWELIISSSRFCTASSISCPLLDTLSTRAESEVICWGSKSDAIRKIRINHKLGENIVMTLL